jgi:hypothetical protein
MSVREKDNPALYTRIQEQNLLRQYDLLSNCVEIGLEKGIEAFDKYTLWALNYAAVANIAQLGGRYREDPILVGNIFLRTLKMSRILWIDSFLLSTRIGQSLTTQLMFRRTLCGD